MKKSPHWVQMEEHGVIWGMLILLRSYLNISILLVGDTEPRLLDLQEFNGNLMRISFTQITHPERLTREQQSDFERLSP